MVFSVDVAELIHKAVLDHVPPTSLKMAQPNLTLPVPLFPCNPLKHCFLSPPLKVPPLWPLPNFLTSAGISNGTLMSEDSRMTLTNERKHVVCLSGSVLVYSR